MKVTIRNFNLNNIEVKQLNKGVVSIQFYNVGGFEKNIKLILGRDLNGDEFDDRVFYYNVCEPVRISNNDCDSYDNFCIGSIAYDDDCETYYDDLYDFIVDSIKRYFNKSNKFITAIINKVIYDNLMKGEFMA